MLRHESGKGIARMPEKDKRGKERGSRQRERERERIGTCLYYKENLWVQETIAKRRVRERERTQILFP